MHRAVAWLLFPEALVMLVLSKVDLVTKGAIVPLLAQRTHAASPPAGPFTDEGAPRPPRPPRGPARRPRGTDEPAIHYEDSPPSPT